MNKTPKNIFGLFFVFSLILIGSFIFTNKASAATSYYVDATGGLDTNNGTSEATAYKTITKVNTKTFLPGDSLLFKRGETWTGIRLTMDDSGTEEQKITIGAYGTGSDPIIDANNTITYALYTASAQHIIIDHIHVKNATTADALIGSNITINYGTATGGAIGYYFNGGSGSSLNYSTVTGTIGTRAIYIYNVTGFEMQTVVVTENTRGIYISGGSNITMTDVNVSSSTLTGVFVTGVGSGYSITRLHADNNGQEGLYFYNSDASVLSDISIIDSEFNDNVGNGLGFAGTGSQVEVLRSTSSRNHADGFNIHGEWTNVVFDYTTADNNGLEEVSGAGDGYSFHETSTGTIKHSIARNNLKTAVAHVGDSVVNMEYNLFTHTTSGTLSLVYLSESGNFTFYNNTLYSGGQTGTGLEVNGATTNIKNNIIYGFDIGFLKTSGTITEDYNDVYGAATTNYSGISVGAHDVSIDPIFTSSSNFKLLPTSLAINAGTNVSLTSDYLGNPIVGAPDIGAYEFQAPTSPTSLSQYKADGTTVITSGTFTNEDNVVLKFNMSSSEYNSSDLLTPQVEIQELDIPFTNTTVTNSGTTVAYSGSDVEGIVTVTGLTSGKTYHWQARVSNPATTSAWVLMGGNPDFQVDTTAPLTPIASPSAGTYYSTQNITLTADGSDSIRYSIIETPADCSSGTLYTVPISISTSQTIYVRACDSLNNSSTSTFNYVIATRSSSGSSVISRYNNLINMGNLKTAEELKKEFPNQLPNDQIPLISSIQTTSTITPTPSISIIINRILKLTTPRMWGDDIKALQTLLNTKGYDSGIPDGNFGHKTHTAVVAFQTANGLTPDGSVGTNTLKYLNEDQTTTTTSPIQPTVTRILKLSIPRMIGDDVLALQTYLSTNGYDIGTPDGIFGSKTYSAVISFQTANNLKPDGIVGPKTQSLMK